MVTDSQDQNPAPEDAAGRSLDMDYLFDFNTGGQDTCWIDNPSFSDYDHRAYVSADIPRGLPKIDTLKNSSRWRFRVHSNVAGDVFREAVFRVLSEAAFPVLSEAASPVLSEDAFLFFHKLLILCFQKLLFL